MQKIYVSLSQNIEGNLFIKRINDLIKNYGDTTDCILKVEIVKINNDIPKIEYNGKTSDRS